MSDAVPSYTTAADGCRLAWRRDGATDGKPLLLCNSIGTGLSMWDGQVEMLGSRFQIIRFDTRGHGQSDAPDGDYQIATLAGDAATVMDAAGVDAAVVCGISLGGVVAMRLALDQPDRVSRLVLADTAARIGTAQSWEERRRKVLADGMAEMADLSMERFFSPAFRHREPAVVAAFREALRAFAPSGYAGCSAALRDSDLTAEVGRIDVPTLIISGLQDVSTPPEQMDELSRAIPGSSFASLDAAHLSNVELSTDFSQRLLDFLRE